MVAADVALVYYSPEVVAHKKLEPISIDLVSSGFGPKVKIVTSTEDVRAFLADQSWSNSILLMMSSGNFDGIDYDLLGEEIIKELKN
jgi:UDP-N-acetylmuramate: L-alanyl-gamma-D-glutamyl-meso-diaminopimelate ligase